MVSDQSRDVGGRWWLNEVTGFRDLLVVEPLRRPLGLSFSSSDDDN